MSGPNSDQPNGSAGEESGIARVLRATGGRDQPSEHTREVVRAAAHAEWRAMVARRKRQRAGLAIAASVAVAAIIALWMSRGSLGTPATVVANVSRVTDDVRVRDSDSSWGSWRAVTIQPLHAGSILTTGAGGRVALWLSDGVSLRLDHETRIAFVDTNRVQVRAGAVYVDAGAMAAGAPKLRVETPSGVIHHVGTQYEVRLVSGGSTRVRVREGRVDVTPVQGQAQSVGVGEQLLVTSSGNVQRASIAPDDREWDWAASTAPTFDINGRRVRDFLTWVGRETGRGVVFATAESEAEADRAVLSGSVTGLTPAQALEAVLPTTNLESVERDGQIVVSLMD